MTEVPENSPTDWYPSSENPPMLRWWDGSQWTEHTRPGALQPYELPGSEPLGSPSEASWLTALERFIVAHPVLTVVLLLVVFSIGIGPFSPTLASFLWIGGAIALLIWREALKKSYPDSIPPPKRGRPGVAHVASPWAAPTSTGSAAQCRKCGSNSLWTQVAGRTPKRRFGKHLSQVTCINCGHRRRI